MIWMLEPALLTLISLSLLVLALVDYFVPTIISIFCTADSWTGQKEKKLNEICHNLSEAILRSQSLWTSVVTMRNSRPNLVSFYRRRYLYKLFVNSYSVIYSLLQYYGTIMIFLVFFAWLGNTINNLLLSYITGKLFFQDTSSAISLEIFNVTNFPFFFFFFFLFIVNAILLTPGFKYKGRARSAVKYIHNYLIQEKLS